MSINQTKLNRSYSPFTNISGGTFGIRPSHFPVFAKEDGTGDADADETNDQIKEETTIPSGKKSEQKPPVQPDSKEADKLARDLAKKDRALSDAQAKLEAANSQLEKFKDIDPEKVRELMTAAEAAQEAALKAEEDRLRASGDYDALRRRMADEHEKAIKVERDAVVAANSRIDALNKQIHEITIGAAFSASSYIRDNTVLPASKARRAYEDHFQIVDGVITAYDRPATDPNREPLVNASGKPLSFEDAIKSIVEADEDSDRILRSTHKAGSGQMPTGGGTPAKNTSLTGVNAIADALRNRSRK